MDDKALIQQWVAKRSGQSRNLKTDGTYLYTRGNVPIGVHVRVNWQEKDTPPGLLITHDMMEPAIFMHKPEGKQGAVALRQYGIAWRCIEALKIHAIEIDSPLPTPGEDSLTESVAGDKSIKADV